jgi:hypothetical protein
MNEYLYSLHDDADIGHSGSEYSTTCINFGHQPNFSAGGVEFGLHVIVTELFTGMASGNFWIVSDDTDNPTLRDTGAVQYGRSFLLADLTLGKHYFIPAGPTLKQYARAYYEVVSTNVTNGEVTMYFGPREGGEE